MFRVLAGFRSTFLTGPITLSPAIFVVQFQESLYKIAIFCQEKYWSKKYWSGQERWSGQGKNFAQGEASADFKQIERNHARL